jgi:hypothetical protein
MADRVLAVPAALLAVLASLLAPAPATAAAPIALGVWSNPDYWESLSWKQRHLNAETQFGPYEGHWRQFKPPDKNGQLTSDEEWALANGKRLFVNWKVAGSGTWAQTAAGARDAVIVAAAQDWARHCRPDVADHCWVTFHHEPENDIKGAGSGMTAADYVAMQRHIVTLWRRHAPQVRVVWTMAGSDSKRWLFPQLWPGTGYADMIGHDPYIRAKDDPKLLAAKMVDRSKWFRANIAALPVVLPEWGTDLDGVRGTVEHRRAAFAEVTRRLPEIAATHLDALGSAPREPPVAHGGRRGPIPLRRLGRCEVSVHRWPPEGQLGLPAEQWITA